MIKPSERALEMLAAELEATGHHQDVVARLRASDYQPEHERDFVTAALAAIDAALASQGDAVRVPREPTKEMRKAGKDAWWRQHKTIEHMIVDIFQAMSGAALASKSPSDQESAK